jgi:hypothetical protein
MDMIRGRPMIVPDVKSCLSLIRCAADAGDSDAAAWLRSEGRIEIASPTEARFVRWEDADGRTSARALEWSRAVYERDGYSCTECGCLRGGKLNAHHLKSWAEHPELRFDVANGVTLCRECHAKKHPGRENLIRNARFLKSRNAAAH